MDEKSWDPLHVVRPIYTNLVSLTKVHIWMSARTFRETLCSLKSLVNSEWKPVSETWKVQTNHGLLVIFLIITALYLIYYSTSNPSCTFVHRICNLSTSHLSEHCKHSSWPLLFCIKFFMQIRGVQHGSTHVKTARLLSSLIVLFFLSELQKTKGTNQSPTVTIQKHPWGQQVPTTGFSVKKSVYSHDPLFPRPSRD